MNSGLNEAPNRSKLALKGSSKTVSDFFEYSINSILYQRGIYAPEDFITVKKYGLFMLVSSDDDVKNYIKKIMSQLHKWVYGGKIGKLIVAIISKDTGEVVERWQFDIEILEENKEASQAEEAESQMHTDPKSKEDIQKEIQAIIRQITASVTFLPVLEGPHTFNVLVYADPNVNVPNEWADSDSKEINGASVENVQLRSFSTSNHKVGTLVSYKLNNECI